MDQQASSQYPDIALHGNLKYFSTLSPCSFDIIVILPSPIIQLLFRKLDNTTIHIFSYVNHLWRDMVLENRTAMEKMVTRMNKEPTNYENQGNDEEIFKRISIYTHDTLFTNTVTKAGLEKYFDIL